MVSERFVQRANRDIASTDKPSAPRTTATGLPKYGVAENTSTCWNGRVTAQVSGHVVKCGYVALRGGSAWSTPFSNGPCDCRPCSGSVEVNVTTGTVKKVVADRGFGFITAEDAKEYFFHRGALDSTLDFDRLVGGERVQFDVEQSPKGPRASRVSAA